MLRKCLTAVVLAGFVSVSFLGCGSDDEESSVGAVTSEMTAKKSETSKKQNKTSVPKNKQEREQPIRFDVSGIEVSKEDMDRLIPYAKSKKLTEDDVRYVAALLKLCGVDPVRMHGISLHSLPGEIEYSCTLDIEGTRNSKGEYCVTSIRGNHGQGYPKMVTIGKDVIGVASLIDLLSLQEINKKADNIFVKFESLEQMKIDAAKALKEKALGVPTVMGITTYGRSRFDEKTGKVFFDNQIKLDVSYKVKSAVYGAEPETKMACIIFDFDGNVKSIEDVNP